MESSFDKIKKIRKSDRTLENPNIIKNIFKKLDI